MNKRNPLWLSMTLALSLLATGQLYAQDSDNQDDADESEESADLEQLSVTGSLIKRTGVDILEPSIVIDAELLRDRGINNIADILNETPAFGAPAATPQGGQNGFSVGQSFVNFLGLGSSRTLTVVNGRRFVSSNAPTIFGEAGGLQVDLNAIPVALVDNIETISIGGASTYGSDAIAGVINVTLRDDFEGFELGAQYGIYDIGGDPDSVSLSATWGANFDQQRGNVAISVEFNNQSSLDFFGRPLFATGEPVFLEEADGVNPVSYTHLTLPTKRIV